MDLITLILVAIAVLIAVISLFFRPITVHRYFDPSGPENEKEDPNPPEEP